MGTRTQVDGNTPIRSVRRSVLRAGHPLAVKIPVMGAPCGRVCDGAQPAPPLSSDLSRKFSAPIGRTGPERCLWR
jgi:hypothetical protein